MHSAMLQSAPTVTFFQKKIKVWIYLAKMVHFGILSMDPNWIPPKIEIWGV